MDEQLNAQLHDAVDTYLAKCGVPTELRPSMDFSHSNAIETLLATIVADYDDDHDEPYLRKRLRAAFTQPFGGDAHEQLFKNLLHCWHVYCTVHSTYDMYPSIALVQSTGFGKSRTIRELAETCHRDHQHDINTSMNVLYVCARQEDTTSDFPPATGALNDYLFPQERALRKPQAQLVHELKAKLIAAFTYCIENDNWGNVSGELLTLFDCATSHHDVRFAQLFAEYETRNTLRGTGFQSQPPQRDGESTRLLVLAVDDVSALQPAHDMEPRVAWVSILRDALRLANFVIWERYPGGNAGIFAVLVDSDYAAVSADRGVVVPCTGTVKSLPPLVLTATMEVFFHHAARARPTSHHSQCTRKWYRRSDSWKALRLMGRPLWMHGPQDKHGLSLLAAHLLVGSTLSSSVLSVHSLTPACLDGVASVLCRLGLRPVASASRFASRAVATMMAIMSHIGRDRDDLVVCSYASDPILALGATELWHGLGPRVLADKILPQLHRLLHREVLDVHASCCCCVHASLVARMVLLLAMDACGVLRRRDEHARWQDAGEFATAWTLLAALHGESPRVLGVMDDDDDAAMAMAWETMAHQWSDWFVSFTQFVQLTETPSEACLWAMLGRRVAGVLPRRCRHGSGVGDHALPQFVIPIVKKTGRGTVTSPLGSAVTMILVQVVTSHDLVREETMVDPAPERCISMRFHGEYQRVYRSSGAAASFTLCVDGLGGGWSSRLDPTATAEPLVEVVSSRVAAQLELLLLLQAGVSPVGNVQKVVADDVRTRNKHEQHCGLPSEELLRNAQQVSVEELLLMDTATPHPGGDGAPVALQTDQ